jgi:hypothetical protein
MIGNTEYPNNAIERSFVQMGKTAHIEPHTRSAAR